MSDLQQEVTNLIYLESTLLDRRKWDDWIDLYTEDAVYWVPSWANEEETTEDPELQLNLIYLRNRGGLEDRVFRIESRDSYASVPLDRTVPVVGNVLVGEEKNDEVDAKFCFCVANVHYQCCIKPPVSRQIQKKKFFLPWHVFFCEFFF